MNNKCVWDFFYHAQNVFAETECGHNISYVDSEAQDTRDNYLYCPFCGLRIIKK